MICTLSCCRLFWLSREGAMTCLVILLLTQRIPSLPLRYQIHICNVYNNNDKHGVLCLVPPRRMSQILNAVEVRRRGTSCFRRPVRCSPEADVVKTVSICSQALPCGTCFAFVIDLHTPYECEVRPSRTLRKPVRVRPDRRCRFPEGRP